MITLTLLLLILALVCFIFAAVKGDSTIGYIGLALWVLTEIVSRVGIR